MKMLLRLIALLGLVPALLQADVTFEVIAAYDYPGFGATIANKINEAGDVGGWVDDLAGHRYGYIRNADGHVSNLISFPGSSFTEILGINNLRQVCGSYEGGPQPENGFRANHRHFVTTNFPRAQTAVLDLNDAGNYCGWESEDGGTYFAFINIDKTYTPFGVPGQDRTVATDINNLNQCVGFYSNNAGTNHSFFRDADGSLTYPIDGPGFDYTAIYGLDDAGRMVGIGCLNGTCYGTLFLTSSEIALYSFPGAFITTFTGINSSGMIGGYWGDGLQAVHAFIVTTSISED